MATMTTTAIAMAMAMIPGHGCCLPLRSSALASIAKTMQNPSSSSSSSFPPRFFLHFCTNRPFSVAARAAQDPPLHLFPFAIGLSFPSPASAADSLPESSSVQAMESSGGSVAASGAADENLAINILGIAAFVGVVVLTVAVIYLAVTDLLERRRRDEETKKLIEESKNTKKKKVSTSGTSGPKGFGKKKLEDSD